MSGYLKTVSNLGQKVFACAYLPVRAGREAFAALEKAGSFRQGGLLQAGQVPGY